MRNSVQNKNKFKLFFLHGKNIFLFFISVSFLVAGAMLLWSSFLKIPDFNTFHDRKIVESTKIYDRTGKILLYDVHENIKRTITPFEQISTNLKNATIAIEDANFYKHSGIDPKSIIRAIIANITGGGFKQGGSTITQQVVKKTLLTDEKQITRKLKEVILSFKLEQAFSKDQILGLYLNENPYGGNIYGIGEASMVFFGKEPSNLSLAQSAYLAALPNAPTYYSPYGNHRDKLEERKNFVLKRMYDLGFITEKEKNDSNIEKVEFLPREPQGIKAPHFVEMIKEYLVIKYGERAVLENGYKITTTLDYELQKKAEETISSFSPKIEKNFNAKNIALVAINPKNGQLLSLVGSRNYFDVKNEGNFNVALAHRQPGSTFKPFVYSTAFIKGYTPETMLFDLPTNFSTNCDSKGQPIYQNIKPKDCYMPENYDGKYRGPISIREALAQSLNIPAVKTLYLAGVTNSIATARRIGITSLTDANQYGLTLVLGGGEVSLFELTGAYGVFANDGVKNPTQFILKVEDKDGNTLEEFKESPEDVLPSEISRKITSILSDNKARTPEFGANSALYFPNKDVAVKTGTTNDYRDVWTVGYTPNITVGMWAGNNDNSPMQKNIAGFIITPVWHAFMEEAIKLTPSERFIKPEQEDLTELPAPLAGEWKGGEKYIIDKSSGKLASTSTPMEMKGLIVVPEVHSILYWVDKNNPRGPRPTSPQNDPQFNLWEEPIREWFRTQNINEGDRSGIPTEYDTNHSTESSPTISLSGIDFNKTHSISDFLSVTVNSIGKYPVDRIEFFINGNLIEKQYQSPSVFSFTPSEISSLLDINTISFIVYDSILNKTVYTTQLRIQ